MKTIALEDSLSYSNLFVLLFLTFKKFRYQLSNKCMNDHFFILSLSLYRTKPNSSEYTQKEAYIFYFSLRFMQRDKSKSPKRSRPNLRSSASHQKNDSSIKKRKNSEESKILKTQTKQALEAECFICASPYNLNRKLPVIACQNQHTFCLNCINLSIKASKLNCPTCRTKMLPQKLNATLYHEVLKIYKEKNQHLEENSIQKVSIKLNAKKFTKKYSNFEDFETVPRTNKFSKIKRNNEPSLLVLQPEIKDKSIHTFSLVYYPQHKPRISFGVCIYDKFLLKLVENCGFDTKIIEFFMKKDDSILKTTSKEGLKIIVNVDLEKYEIHWFEERKTNSKEENHLHLISSDQIEINNKVGDLSYYPFCVLYNIGDMIELNR